MRGSMEYDVFFSYPHKDALEVDQILKALQEQGLNVWIDKSEIRDFESITKSIVEGLAQSKVLLAYYSPNYWRSRACQWELTAAFLAAQNEGDPRKRVLIINPEEKTEHIHPVELRDELFLTKFKDSESLVHLVNSVKNHIKGITKVIGEIYALNQTRWYGKKGVGSNRFVGRLPDMWKIHSALLSSELPIITGCYASPVVQVQGMGGIGKSILVEEYALRYAAAFQGGVFWLRAFGNDNIKTALKPEELEAERIRQVFDIAIAYGIPAKDRSFEEIEAHFTMELERVKKPFLWVVDDLPHGMDIEALQRWIAPHPLGKTLITTRSKEYSALGKLVPLGVLDPKEAWDLLTFWRKPEKEEEKDARMLIEDLGHHALAVDVAGAALHVSEGLQSFSEFRKDLANPTIDELELAAELTGMLPTGHEKSIASTLLRSIKLLGEEGRDFLLLASMLATAPIPASLVSDVFSEVDKIDESSGKQKAKTALSQVDRFSLAERTEDEPGARTVHVLISRTVRFLDSQPKRSEMLREAAIHALIVKLSIIGDYQVHNELKISIIHARMLVNGKGNLIKADLMNCVASYDFLRGAYKSAETLLFREWDIRNRFLGDMHPSTLSTMNHLAIMQCHLGNYTGSRKLHEQILGIRQKVLGDEHIDTLNTKNNLAVALTDLGDYVRAKKLYEQILKTCTKLFGNGHPLTLTAMRNLAITQSNLGDYAGAKKLNEKVLAIQQKEFGDKHHDTLITKNNLAEILRLQGDYTGARVLIEQVLEIWQKILGDEHPDTLIAISNLAIIQCYQGEFSRSRKLNEQVLETCRKVLGYDHPATLTTMNNLAETLSYLGDYTEARILLEQILEIQRKELGDEHNSTFNTMNNLAETLSYLGDYAKARILHEQVFEKQLKILGREHPYTLNTMNNLAATIHDLGDFAGARKLHEKALEIRRNVLGEEHPDTLSSMNNLAITLHDLGDFAGARKLHEQVLEKRRNILGNEHPDTLTTMNNFASTFYRQGEYTKAKKLNEQTLEICRKVLGDEHPSTLIAKSNLANTLYSQGDNNEAIKLNEQVLEIQQKILGDEHPNTLITKSNLANAFYRQGDFGRATNLNEQILEIQQRMLGTGHPITLNIMNNLAEMLILQGNYAKSSKLLEQILEIRCEILGDEHPDTLTTMDILVITLSYLGDYSGARKINEKMLDTCRKVFGDKHPATSLSVWSLFVTLSNMDSPDITNTFMREHLLWLIECAPIYLAAEQLSIRDMVVKIAMEKTFAS